MLLDDSDLYAWYGEIERSHPRKPWTQDVIILRYPKGIRRGCRSRRKRTLKKLFKRGGVFHYRDAKRVEAYSLRDAYISEITQC